MPQLTPLAFPHRAKFLPLRIVTLDRASADAAIGNKLGCAAWNLPKIREEHTRALQECEVVFLDARNPHAVGAMRELKSISKIAVGYVACAALGGMVSREDMGQTYMKLHAMKACGWEYIELSFGPGVNPMYAQAVLNEARRIGLAACLYVDKSIEALKPSPLDWQAAALSSAEIRSSKVTALYRNFLDARIPIYSTEYGKPGSPGKSKLDLKSFAIRFKMSLTLANFGLRDGTEDPFFHFQVTY